MVDSNEAIIILVLLSLMFLGFVAMFNLGAKYTPALDVSFKGTGINIFWAILLRIIIAPLMMIVPAYVIYNIIRG